MTLTDFTAMSTKSHMQKNVKMSLMGKTSRNIYDSKNDPRGSFVPTPVLNTCIWP